MAQPPLAQQPAAIEAAPQLPGPAELAQAMARVLEQLSPAGRLWAFDKDPEAIAEAALITDPRFAICHASFGDMAAELAARGVEQVNGILLDLGVSSPQLDHAHRGFSFSSDAPLDMRMDPDHGATAADLLGSITMEDLTQLLRENGEAKYARRLAKTLLEGRPQTTAQLVGLVDGAIPKGDRRRGHVASRVFQALRIAVNQELDELSMLLSASITLLAPGGRLAVIAYHSGEDAMVKHTMRDWELGGCICPATLPCVCGATSKGHCVNRRAVTATEQEILRYGLNDNERERIGLPDPSPAEDLEKKP
jgi:16S rRNA (cytosine1402-N4)-methyltransferase